MTKYKIDKELNPNTKKYIKSVINKLSDVDGNVDDVWFASLDLIAQNHQTIIQCNEQIKTDGMMIKNRFGDYTAHPLIKVQENASIQLQKLLSEFLLTKKSALKVNESNDNDDESPLMNFVKTSTKFEKR